MCASFKERRVQYDGNSPPLLQRANVGEAPTHHGSLFSNQRRAHASSRRCVRVDGIAFSRCRARGDRVGLDGEPVRENLFWLLHGRRQMPNRRFAFRVRP